MPFHFSFFSLHLFKTGSFCLSIRRSSDRIPFLPTTIHFFLHNTVGLIITFTLVPFLRNSTLGLTRYRCPAGCMKIRCSFLTIFFQTFSKTILAQTACSQSCVLWHTRRPRRRGGPLDSSAAVMVSSADLTCCIYTQEDLYLKSACYAAKQLNQSQIPHQQLSYIQSVI